MMDSESPCRGMRSVLWPAALLIFWAVLQACSSLSDQEEIALNIYKQNSKSYYNNGNYREAVDQCRRGLELDENDRSLNLTLGFALLKLEGIVNLFSAYEQFKKTDSLSFFEDDYRIDLGLGQVCYKIATYYRKQLAVYENKIEVDPDCAELYQKEINECREGMTSFLEEALDRLSGTLTYERQKDNVEAVLTLGQTYAYSGNDEEAIRYLLRGIDLLEKSTSFQQERLDDKNNTTSDGRRFFQRNITKNLRLEKELRGILAFVYQRKGDFSAALEQYDLLEERDLFDDIQYYNRGVTLQELGRYEEAIEDYNHYLTQASVTGKKFDEDEHFHMAFERIEACKVLAARGSPAGGGP